MVRAQEAGPRLAYFEKRMRNFGGVLIEDKALAIRAYVTQQACIVFN